MNKSYITILNIYSYYSSYPFV